MAASEHAERGVSGTAGPMPGRGNASCASPRRVQDHEESGCCCFRLRRKGGGEVTLSLAGAGGGQRGKAPGTKQNPSLCFPSRCLQLFTAACKYACGGEGGRGG